MKKIILLSSVLFIGAVSFMMATSTTSEQAAPAPQTVVQLEPSADQPSESMQPISVVELFTSQGCSSCPPANQFASKLASDGDKLVLTYGVTYWDYLGWKDTFGDPEFTVRQRDYGKALGTPNIYTPQLVLNGSAHSPRYSRNDVETMLLADSKAEADISVSNGRLVVSSAIDSKAKLVIIAYKPGVHSVDVKRGENGGRTLEVSNVVTDVMPTDWKGESLETNIQIKNGQAYAALFHDPKSAKIMTAAVYSPI